MTLALATALFRDGDLSLAHASRLAEMALGEFVVTSLPPRGLPW